MNTISEIVQYCNETNTVEALLITGPWGCGKTYLLNYDIKKDKAITDYYVPIRISLFGIDSAKMLHQSVKREFAKEYYRNKKGRFNKNRANTSSTSVHPDKEQGIFDKQGFGKSKDLIEYIPMVGAPLKKLLSVGWLEFINVEADIDGKRALFVFDDIERRSPNLDNVTLLGCLNEYLEIRGLKIILIAHEDEIIKRDISNNDEIDHITYHMLKEKLIARTILHIPDYNKVIQKIIFADYFSQLDYRNFLLEHIDLIQLVFSNSGYNNLRSLKCALIDFKRIWSIECFQKLDTELQRRILYSFHVLVYEHKAGVLTKEHGTQFIDTYLFTKVFRQTEGANKDEQKSDKANNYKRKYNNLFSIENLPSCEDWIISGKWDETNISKDLKRLFDYFRPASPDEAVLRGYWTELEDEVFEEGFPIMLENAYKGELTLNEYLNLVLLRIQSSGMSVELPEKINFSKVHIAVNARIEKITNGEILEREQQSRITEKDLEIATFDEKAICEDIFRYYRDKEYIRNRKAYIQHMNSNVLDEYNLGFRYCFYHQFSTDMAEATAKRYFELPAERRNSFITHFKEHWERDIKDSSILDNHSQTIESFDHLINLLSAKGIKGRLENARIKRFIEVLNELKRTEPKRN